MRSTISARRDVPLAPFTTLRLGGRAARMVDIEREKDIGDVMRDAEAAGEPVFVLGGGSNVVVADEGFSGLVVRMSARGVLVSRAGGRVVVEVAAGEPWDALVARAVDEGWVGFACMSGIPGLVGATPVQNVGAYGEEVSEAIDQVRVYDRLAHTFHELPACDCKFAYRDSLFKRSDRWVVTGVRFKLALGEESVVRYPELARALSVAEGGRAPSRLVRQAVIALRRSKGMVIDPADPETMSAGSFFVNPMVDARGLTFISARAGTAPPSFDAGGGQYKVPAAWLVERAGFVKGWGSGPAGVSRKHALALVNRGGATTRELLTLARSIRDGVKERFGVVLAPEPVFVGCSWA